MQRCSNPHTDKNFDFLISSDLSVFCELGTADLALMPACNFSKAPLNLASCRVDSEHLESARTFKVENRALREVIPPMALASQAEGLITVIRNTWVSKTW